MKTTNLVLAIIFLAASSFIVYNKGVKETYKISPSKSSIGWLAKKVTGQHNGTVGLKSGSLEVEDGKLTGGEFVMDMTSIKVLDLKEGTKNNEKLVGHLKSPDFFNVEKHTAATLKITDVKKTGKQASSDKAQEYKITADLTIKGHKNSIDFTAYVKVDGANISARTNKIIFDRSKFDVRYGSETFFGSLGNKAIYNDIEMKITLEGKK